MNPITASILYITVTNTFNMLNTGDWVVLKSGAVGRVVKPTLFEVGFTLGERFISQGRFKSYNEANQKQISLQTESPNRNIKIRTIKA